MSIFSLRPAEVPTNPDHPRCVVFKWIGQSFNSCDQCGRPDREHLYHPPYGNQPTLFRVKEHDKRLGWYWEQVGSLVRAS